jgi:hypothetical protein
MTGLTLWQTIRLKLKIAVKLQSAMRGQLAWHQAIGVLHCVGDVVKMQALVRARAYVEEEGGEKHDRPVSKILPVTNSTQLKRNCYSLSKRH